MTSESRSNPPVGASPRPLYYTFANHMHWVDMQWLWGYHVLPGSVRDMLHLCRETGARGGVNFDAVGYEKLAAESPEALAELREAVAQGVVEPVGCSYGQPYGLFQPLESNIRQFTYGVRATQRLLGVRPRTFWEEEFYFFPQLPQVLRQCGYTGACLFFQWTWHTPEIPREPHSLIVWEGADGTGILTLPRNDLNVHQWSEDFDGLLEGPAVHAREDSWGAPAIAQWLELMPSRDWMCRSDVLLPRLKELMDDARFEVRARTPGEVIRELAEQAGRTGGTPVPPAPSALPASLPRRRYQMDDVWHGMTLGKNADRHPRRSVNITEQIIAAEAIAAVAGLFGRPYPSWDVYPTWELDEAWRELLAAQHHDNHECEGLCGHIGYTQFERADALAEDVFDRTQRLLARRSAETGGGRLIFNPRGFLRPMDYREPQGERVLQARDVPPFGYRAIGRTPGDHAALPTVADVGERTVVLRGGDLEVEIDPETGGVRQIRSAEFPEGALDPTKPLWLFTLRRGGKLRRLDFTSIGVETDAKSRDQWVEVELECDEDRYTATIGIDIGDRCITLTLEGNDLAAPDPGFAGAVRTAFTPRFDALLRADQPGAVAQVKGSGEGRRKYPTGDWMTSGQWFETVEGAFTGLHFVDMIDASDERGLLLTHTGGHQFFETAHGFDAVMTAYDPWDESEFRPKLFRTVRLYPHGRITDADRVRLASLHHVGRRPVRAPTGEAQLPPVFGPLSVNGAEGVLAEAFYRESMYSGERLPDWAGHRMFAESAGACDHPFVIRLLEYNGEPAEVTLKLAGDVAMAAKTNLLGEVPGARDYDAAAGYPHRPGASGAEPASGWSEADCGWLTVEHDVTPPDWAITDGKPIEINGQPLCWSQVRFRMRPREIATIMCDMVMGRKQWRDLDAKREVWATIHKAPGDAGGSSAAGGPVTPPAAGAKDPAP